MSLLNAVRHVSNIDCDTLDAKVAQNLGPFIDCTSNQAIAYFELSKPATDSGTLHYDVFIKQAVQDAQGNLKHLQDGATFREFVVEILMVKLQLLILPNISGFVHLQTNPMLSYSKEGTVANARRLTKIFATLAPRDGGSRVCIKVPASWEGMQACRVLEAEGIATLATTMFCMEQAALAADAQCRYIAPYINELRVHFDPDFEDKNKAFEFCLESQAFYRAKNHATRVLAASFTSVEEVLQLAGIHHLTLSPAILQELAQTPTSQESRALLQSRMADTLGGGSWETKDYESLVRDEAQWRLAFTRRGLGVSEGKLVQAICYFCDFQEKLEELVGKCVS